MHYSKLIALTLVSVVSVAVTRSPARATDNDSQPPPIIFESQKIQLPKGNLKFEGTDPGARVAGTFCVMCHSRGMIDSQPPLSREAWKAEIHKMRTSYGCPVSEGSEEELVEFLYQYNNRPAQRASRH
jgi:cytochrome c5